MVKNGHYFVGKSKRIIKTTIKLLEHVVIEFDLYQNEEKLIQMYSFLKNNVRLSLPFCDKSTIKSNNILDRWNMDIFRLQMNRFSEKSSFINTILS